MSKLSGSFGALGISVALGLFLYAVPGQAAGYVVTLDQVGPNVVATGSGGIDLTGLTLQQSATEGDPSVLNPSNSFISTGPPAIVDVYQSGSITGPANFGIGGFTLTNSSAGDEVEFNGSDLIKVTAGYQSGQALSDSATYLNKTFASLGVTPGVYEWSWGLGAEQNFTLDIESVPEPATWFAATLVLVSLFCLQRKTTRRSANRIR